MKAVSFVESLISPELVHGFSHGLSRLSSPGGVNVSVNDMAVMLFYGVTRVVAG